MGTNDSKRVIVSATQINVLAAVGVVDRSTGMSFDFCLQ